jgi:hypothetical protein
MITPLYLASKANLPRLRVAVLLDGPAVPQYVATILEDIARSNFAEVVLAVLAAPARPTVRERLSGLAHELYVRADRAFGGASDPLHPIDPGESLSGVERLEVTTAAARAADEPWLAPSVVEEIRRRDLDVILRFSAATPRGPVLRAARYGVWSYHFGAEGDPRDGTPLFRQHVTRAPTRDVVLEVLEDESGVRLMLCRSRFGTRGNAFLAPYRHVAFWETTHFVLWKLRDLHELGWERVREQALPRAAPAASPGVARPPTTADMLRFLTPRVATAFVNRVRGERRKHGVSIRWQIGLRRSATPLGNTPESTSLDGFRWIRAPQGHYWADPFLFARDANTFVLFEDYDYERGYGTIRGAEVGSDCSLGPHFPCLDLGKHLSFPLVFDHEGETFMIPESLADGTVSLYRARHFPDDWVLEKVLFRGKATDTTCWREGKLFYFFTTLHDRDDRGMKTIVFVADSLTGQWRPHPSNPVSSDARHARNAGRVFRRQGRLFRPSQNCGPGYGYGLNLEEITTLSEDRYEERTWCAIEPSALPFAAIGLHTFDHCDELEAIDACISLGRRW